ncbi:MAG: type VI secretion system tube protein Hcp [Akkermansiaceae bacterium]
MKFSTPGGEEKAFNGDSKDLDYRAEDGWFIVDSYSLGIENTVSIYSISGGTEPGRATFKNLIVSKKSGAGSAHFFETCATGNSAKIATLVVRRPRPSPEKPAVRVFQAEFHLTRVQSVVTDGSRGDDESSESLIFQYGAHRIEFFTTDELNREFSAGVTTWSQVKNNESTEVGP